MEFELEEVVSLIRVGFKEPFGERLFLVLEEVFVGMNLVPMEHTRPFKAKVCVVRPLWLQYWIVGALFKFSKPSRVMA